MSLRNLYISISLIVFTFINLNAQPRFFIDGYVTDASTHEPLPYSNIHFQINRNGTITYSDGYFSINTNTVPDSMIISAIGYETKIISISEYKNQSYLVELQPKQFELNEVVILPGENPAIRIMKNVIDEKTRNNPLKNSSIACNTYTKILVNALSDLPDKETNKGIPIYFSEKLSQNLIQTNPDIELGKIITENRDGLGFLEEMSILGYSNNMSLDYNFYENVVEIFDKPFISPLNSRAFLFYKFYLKDSVQTEFGKEYLLEVKPRNDRDLAFSGHLRVIDDEWALSEISLSIPQNANLNYVNKLQFYQSFVPVNDTLTFFHINEINAELKIMKDKSLIDINFNATLQKRSIYNNVVLNFPKIDPGNEELVWSKINPVLHAIINKKDPMSNLRPESLSEKELKAIISIDSLNNTWKIRSADALSKMFITGYIPGEFFDLGPYLELVKNNKVEGYRYTFAGRTSTTLTKNTMIFGHIGYGTRDDEWKYGLGVKQKFGTINRRLASLEYRNDLSRIGDNRSIFLIKENMMVSGEDNVIASLFTNSPLNKLSREIRFEAAYEHEWKRGVSTFISLTNRKIHTGIYMPFIHQGNTIDHFNTNELMLGLRLSWQENFTDNYCRRYYMVTSYPIVNIRVTGGQYHLSDVTNPYLTARAVVNHDVNFGQTKLEYVFESGITLGSVPFALLEITRTDQSLGYALFSYNMMGEMEFASDRFASLMAQYHLNGLVLNRIPVLKRMGIREVFGAKVLWSHLSDKHQQILDYPGVLYDARFPYAELSAGIENFFQYFRFDVVWRLSQLQNPGANAIGFRARFDVNF